MKSIFTLISCLFYLAPLLSKATEDSTAVFFSTNSHHLDEAQRNKLLDFVNDLDQESDFTVVIRGFTDHRGSVDFNRQLSKRRAESVKLFLESQGLYPGEIRIEPLGESRAELQGNVDEELLSDRRVEVVLKSPLFQNLEQLHEILAHGNESSFRLNPQEPNTVFTSRGSRIYIPAGVLCNKSGEPVTSHINLEITEALDPIEFLAENLSTVSNGVPLISGGMLKIKATDSDGNELQLSKGQNITVNIPDENPDPEMKLFVSENGQNWQPGPERKPFAYKNLPERPIAKYPKFKCPAYCPDLTTKPIKPVEPVLPKELQKPDYSDFEPQYKWYDFLWRKSKERKAHASYAASMKNYMKKAPKYDKRVEKYKEDCRTYSQRKIDYEQALERWEAAEHNRRLEWMRSVHEPAYELWLDEWAKANEIYQTKYNAWKEQISLIKKEQLEDAEANGLLDVNAVVGYSFTSSSLNWINADKFYSEDPAFVKSFEIERTDPFNEKVVVVFKGIKSLIGASPNAEGDLYVTPAISQNQKAVILAYKISESGKLMLSLQDLDPDKTRQQLEYRETNLRELRKTVDEIVS